MSLRSKIVLILVAVVGLYALTTGEVQRRVFSDQFATIECEAARRDVQRVVEALQEEVREVDQLALEWSAWDDAWAFVTGEREAAFERSSLAPERLQAQGIDLLFFLGKADEDNEHSIIWSRSVDPDTGEPLGLRQLDYRWDALPTNSPVLAFGDLQAQKAARAEGPDTPVTRPVGILLTEAKPLIVSARPILRSDRSGSPAGLLILGRYLSESLDSELTAQTKVDFDFWQADGRHELPPDAAAVHNEVAASTEPVLREATDALLHAWATFPDIKDRPELLLRANVARDVTSTGHTAMRFGLVSTLAGGFVMLLALMLLLQRIVLAPVSRLTRHALRIGQTEDFRAKLDIERGDEIGALAGEFNSMMEKLEHARAQLVDTARTAGMSEIATGILHNVGNVLNSVNISASLVSQKVEGMSVDDLKKVSDILEDHRDDLARFIGEDPKGKHLQPFLTALSVQLGEEQRTIAVEMGSLSEGIEHICDLIKSQQEFAVKAELVEEVVLSEKLDEALRITDQAHGADPDLEVVRDYDDLPEVLVDKHRLLEILVNLIQNARQAMSKSGGPPRLTLRANLHGDERVRLRIEDTGMGIEPDVLAKVFNLGFTTKPDGHGYGLHTAANAATEMGGKLTAESEGAGHGAAFVLELPLRIPVHAEEER
jgi:two-component system, NtrC family, sensor kinase